MTLAEDRRFLVVLIAAAGAFALLLWLVPKWRAFRGRWSNKKERFDVENESRKTLAQIFGGIVVIISFYSTFQTLKLSQNQLHLAEQGQVTDRYTKAITQLGDIQIEVRLGGIYGLERITKDSSRDQWAIMEILTAFVREKAPLQAAVPASSPEAQLRSCQMDVQLANRPRTDIQAVMTVVGRRDVSHDDKAGSLELRRVNLTGAFLPEAHFEDAFFSDSDLEQIYWTGAQLQGVDLTRVDLRSSHLGSAVLAGAELTETHLDYVTLKEADFSNIEHFDGSTWNGTAWWRAHRISPSLLEYLIQKYPFHAESRYCNDKTTPDEYERLLAQIKSQ